MAAPNVSRANPPARIEPTSEPSPDTEAPPKDAEPTATPDNPVEDVLRPLLRWTRRLADAGVQQVGPSRPVPAPIPEDQPYERALALWDAGSADDLLAALPLLDALGARAVAALVRARLREAGVSGVPRGRSPATRANPAGLTARQLDVLALLVDGLSNADIATRLVISPKTADHHVSAILAKLDVRSRGEAAAAARRLGV